MNQQKNRQQNNEIEQEQEYSCCEGKLFSIKQQFKSTLTFCLIQIPVIVHQILHISWFSTKHYYTQLYFLIIAQFLVCIIHIKITLVQPGIIPKITKQYQNQFELLDIPQNTQIENFKEISYLVPDKSKVSCLKICRTCNIYRPPRSDHCSICGICIERMDHHCSWLGTCVGKKNYLYYYTFLISVVILILTVDIMCFRIMVQNSSNFKKTLKQYPITIILVLLSIPSIIYFIYLLIRHSILILLNLTTLQVQQNNWQCQQGNPYKKSNYFKNIITIFFKQTNNSLKLKYKKYKHQPTIPEESSSAKLEYNSSSLQEPKVQTNQKNIANENVNKNPKDTNISNENRNNNNSNENNNQNDNNHENINENQINPVDNI